MDGAVNTYTTEFAEVLFSVQLTLAFEQDAGASPPGIATWSPASGNDRLTIASLVGARRAGPHLGSLKRKSEPELRDPSTGAGTMAALERDLRLDRGRMHGGVFTLATVDIAPLSEIRRIHGDEAADEVLRALAEAVPFVLRTGDRIYRTGPDELTMLLPSADLAGAASMCLRLQTAIRDVLVRRELPQVMLSVRPYDRAA